MANIQEAQNRLFKNVYICKNCQSKQKADAQKVHEGRVRCRKCGERKFRTIKRK